MEMMGLVLSKPQPKPMIFLGQGACGQLSQAIGRFGYQRILVVTDKPLLELGALDDTLAALKAAGVDSVIYDGVLPDPTEQVVDAGIDAYQRENCDSVLAFGGGSSIDAAKVIALGAANNCRASSIVTP